MAEALLLLLVAWLLWRGPTRVRLSPDAFATMVQAMPRSTLIVEDHSEWSGTFTYTFRDPSHIIIAESPVTLELPANVVRVAGSHPWWSPWRAA